MKNIRISIITPVYNGQEYIAKCVNAVNNCNYDHNLIEHIIVDDGSTDNTKKICQDLARQYKHIKFYSKSNGNWGSVINYVKHNHLANGDYIIICDSDDIILPNAFKLVERKNKDADMVVGDFYNFNGIKRTQKYFTNLCLFKRYFQKKKPWDYYFVWFPPHCSYLKNKLFYSLPDLTDRFFYQDAILYNEAQHKAKTITHISRAISLYWNVREGNSNSKPQSKLSIESRMFVLSYFENHKMLMPFITTIRGFPEFLKDVCAKNKYRFADKTLSLKAWPFYLRPFVRHTFKCIMKKFVKNN